MQYHFWHRACRCFELNMHKLNTPSSLNTRKSTLEGSKQSGPATGGIALSLLPNFTMLKASRQKPSRMVCIFILPCVAGLKSDVLVADRGPKGRYTGYLRG
jgi:hypothetical protein